MTYASSNLTPGTQQFVDALNAKHAPPLYTLSPDDARKVLEDVQSGAVHKAAVATRDMVLPVGPTGEVPVRLFRPKADKGNALPTILYLHGGGWVMGSRDTHDRLVRGLVAETGAMVVFPEYALSPEGQYPLPMEQAYAVLEHIVANADEFFVASDRLIVAGDSAGANMAVAVALLAAERGGPEIRFQLLLYPVTDADFETASYAQFAEGPWLTRKAMQWFWDAYLPDKAMRNEITASPLKATLEQLKNLPPALVITAENDVLRDEGEAFARKLSQAGVTTACLRCNGTIHDFLMLNALAGTAPADAALCLAVAALRKICL